MCLLFVVDAFRFQPPHGLLPSSDGGSQYPQPQRGLLAPAAAAAAAAGGGGLAAAEGLPASILDLPPSFFKGKRVLVRGDLNVPVMKDSSSNKNGYRVTDETRMRALLPTLRYLLDADARIILVSHFGDPKLPLQDAQEQQRFSLKLLIHPLQQMLNVPVHFAPNCVGEETESMAQQLKQGEVLLLENGQQF